MANEASSRTARLTEKLVEALEHDGKPYVVRDEAVRGFMVAVNKRSKTYKIQRDLWVGPVGRRRLVKTVRRSIERADRMSLKEARREATLLIARIDAGEDPNAKEKAAVVRADAWTVERMFAEYARDMEARDLGERTIADHLGRMARYLDDWRDLPITEVKRSMCRQKHEQLARRHGKVTANKALRDFRSSYNFALRVVDDPDTLPDNPTKAVTFFRECSSGRVIMPSDLHDWHQKLARVPNPTRRLMHEFGLLSGLRPGTLVSLQRDWIDLPNHALDIPKMKSGRSFSLPLSDRMEAIVERLMASAEALYPGTPYLFPSRSKQTSEVIPTRVWKEAQLPAETGHILRHTYRTVAQSIGIDPISAKLLLDHTVPGMDGVYVHERALFGRLLECQQRVTDELTRLMTTPPAAQKEGLQRVA